jgi:hypothetical protein
LGNCLQGCSRCSFQCVGSHLAQVARARWRRLVADLLFWLFACAPFGKLFIRTYEQLFISIGKVANVSTLFGKNSDGAPKYFETRVIWRASASAMTRMGAVRNVRTILRG